MDERFAMIHGDPRGCGADGGGGEAEGGGEQDHGAPASAEHDDLLFQCSTGDSCGLGYKVAGGAQIAANAQRLIFALKQSYPSAKVVMIGALARGANFGGGRRSQVDALLAIVAAKEGLTSVSVGDWLTRYDAVKDLADGVHMTAAGHQKLGAVLAGELKAAVLPPR